MKNLKLTHVWGPRDPNTHLITQSIRLMTFQNLKKTYYKNFNLITSMKHQKVALLLSGISENPDIKND